MRRAILMSLIILLCQPLTAATNISVDTEESSTGTLSGNYTVEDGATWTISGHYEVEDGTTIVVEEGGAMVVTGSMNSTSDPHLEMTVFFDCRSCWIFRRIWDNANSFHQ